MKKIWVSLIAAALICTALPVYAAEDAETVGAEAADSETEDSGSVFESLYLEESEAGEDLSDLTGWSIADEQAQIPMTMAASSSAGNVVVVLDPGHDSTHTGASYSGLREETLNLKIAEYCKEELEEYSGVTVYMTRTTEACPFPGNSNTDDLAGRVNYAASVGATVYVSLHLNANNDTSVSGSQVYCPNTNYNSSISVEGFALADQIMVQLNALGLSNRGIYSVNSQSGTTYPDGSLADYYAVIRRSKLAGFPGIIVEHAFLSNTSDRNTYLSSEASLKALGVADATGIANYYNLSKNNVQKINGVWTYVVNGVPDYTYTGVARNENGWWYIENGVVNFSYTGFAENQYGKWYIESGKVTFQKQDIIKDTTGALGEKDAWYYVSGSKVQTSFTGLSNFRNSYGWWYIQDGKVDFDHNGVDKNINGWWYVTEGKVRFGFTGLANYRNANGWWYIQDGKVDFDHNGVDKNINGWWYVTEGKVRFGFTGLANYWNAYGWWYIKDGKVDFTHTGVDQNKNGWWYVEDGKVDFTHNGVEKNEYGWWYIREGAVDFTYTGIAQNANGWWYIQDGKVNFSYTGEMTIDEKTYWIDGGKVITPSPEETDH